ncbi:MAG: hypothetical protein ACE5I3_16010 [Phycisphaerae bacterium]
MLSKSQTPSLTRPSRCSLPLAISVLFAASGCQDRSADVQLDNPELAAFVRLMMPKEIEIQHYLTRPFDFAGTGDADGLEVILAALDPFGDPVKCIGTFHFKLHTRRMASGDKFDKQIALWTVAIDTDRSLIEYWDRYSRYYRFPLKLSEGTLPPGHYILSAQLVTPTGDKLFDEYEFTHGES